MGKSRRETGATEQEEKPEGSLASRLTTLTESGAILRRALKDLTRAKARKAFLESLSDEELIVVAHGWLGWAREHQMPPLGVDGGYGWRTWVMLGGRGAGKTRAGAEWVRAQALGHEPLAEEAAMRIALVGETMEQARAVMVEGVSGLLDIHPPNERPHYEPSKHQLTWPNGAVAQIYSAENPDSLRGPQFAAAWCDELSKWTYAQETWDMLQFALRLGLNPRQVVTTTPKPMALLKRIMADDGTVMSRMRTKDNADNLAPAFMKEIERRYGGTLLGRQELDGEIVEERAMGLFKREWIDEARLDDDARPELQRIVVAVDPPVTGHKSSDACGIVVAGLGRDGRSYVLADRTLQGRSPPDWARAAVAAYKDFEADRIVAEVNQGGDLVEGVIRQVDRGVPIRQVRATRGKWLRAEPIAALYAEGRVVHVGEFAKLEAQMLVFGADGRAAGKSPDRLDALVWALTELMDAGPREPSLRML